MKTLDPPWSGNRRFVDTSDKMGRPGFDTFSPQMAYRYSRNSPLGLGDQGQTSTFFHRSGTNIVNTFEVRENNEKAIVRLSVNNIRVPDYLKTKIKSHHHYKTNFSWSLAVKAHLCSPGCRRFYTIVNMVSRQESDARRKSSRPGFDAKSTSTLRRPLTGGSRVFIDRCIK